MYLRYTSVSFLFILIFLISITISAQPFEKILDGDFVNDGGESFGVAWADINNDGFPDLFVSNGGASGINSDNFLYLNKGDGAFLKISEGDIVSGNRKSIGSSLSDFNNDGFVDVFTANRDGQDNFLYTNNTESQFTLKSLGSVVNDKGNSNGTACADVDNDGLVDIFVANFFEKNFLYLNIGDFNFSSEENSAPVNVISTSISASWGDFNNDMYPDLIIANAASSGRVNDLFINNGSANFTSISGSPVTTDTKASMGASWGDFNNDGYLDLFVANQANFTNDLYSNNGDGTFTKITEGDIVNETSMSISGSWIDINNDGYLDLFVTNWQSNKNFLYWNDGAPNYTFTKASDGEIVNDISSSMGAAWADYDNDGDLDLFVANRGNIDNSFYKNNTTGNNWVNIKCIGDMSNKSAIGLKIRIKTDNNGSPAWQMREINSQHGYNSQNDIRIHFGLGTAEKIDSMIIEWPSGNLQEFLDVEPNDFYLLEEGTNLSLITSVNESNKFLPESIVLHQNYPNPFNPDTKIQYKISESGFAELIVYDYLGKEVSILVDEYKPAGKHEIIFSGTNLASGVYFYRLKHGNHSSTRKMILIK